MTRKGEREKESKREKERCFDYIDSINIETILYGTLLRILLLLYQMI